MISCDHLLASVPGYSGLNGSCRRLATGSCGQLNSIPTWGTPGSTSTSSSCSTARPTSRRTWSGAVWRQNRTTGRSGAATARTSATGRRSRSFSYFWAPTISYRPRERQPHAQLDCERGIPWPEIFCLRCSFSSASSSIGLTVFYYGIYYEIHNLFDV